MTGKTSGDIEKDIYLKELILNEDPVSSGTDFEKNYSPKEITKMKLTALYIPANISSLGEKLIMDNIFLSRVTFARDSCLKRIKGSAFRGCRNLREVEIPVSVEVLSERCFSVCASLYRVSFLSGSRLKRIECSSFAGCRILKEIMIPESVEFLGENCFSDCVSLSRVIFPLESRLECIEGSAFYGCLNLKEVEISASVEVLGEKCFSECLSLSRVTFVHGSALKRIERFAFCGCRNLKEMNIPTSAEIEYGAFSGCGVAGIQRLVSNSLWFIPNRSNLRDITIPANVEILCEKCFYDCRSLSTVMFAPGSCLKRIENYAFWKSGLNYIEIPTQAEIGLNVFPRGKYHGIRRSRVGNRIWVASGCNTKLVEIPADVEILSQGCFERMDITEEILFAPGSCLKCIDMDVFVGSKCLKRVDIPSTVEILGDECFKWCSSLSMVTFLPGSRLKRIGNGTFMACNRLREIEIPSKVEILCKECFTSCESLTRVTFAPDSCLKTIENSAFSRCKMAEITIPSTVEILCQGCFSNCESLTCVIFTPDSRLKRIEKFAFYGCDNLKKINIPASAEISDSVFFGKGIAGIQYDYSRDCRSLWTVPYWNDLNEIEIPANVEILCTNSFSS